MCLQAEAASKGAALFYERIRCPHPRGGRRSENVGPSPNVEKSTQDERRRCPPGPSDSMGSGPLAHTGPDGPICNNVRSDSVPFWGTINSTTLESFSPNWTSRGIWRAQPGYSASSPQRGAVSQSDNLEGGDSVNSLFSPILEILIYIFI